MMAGLLEGWGLTALLAAGLGYTTATQPLWGLCAFAALFPFDVPLVRESPWTIYTSEAMLAGVFAGFGLARRRTGFFRLDSPGARGALKVLALIWVATAVSAWGAEDRWAAVKQALRWAELWGLLAIVATVIRTRRDAGFVLAAYVVMASILGVLGIVEVIAGPGSWLNAGSQLLDENRSVVRAHGPFSPNSFAPYLGLALMILTAGGDLWPRVPVIWRWVATVPIATALVLTQSRIGWVAAATGLSVIALVRFRHRGRLVLAGAAVTLVLVLALSAVFPGVAGRLASLRHPRQDANFVFRITLFQWAKAQWAHRPFTGYGAGAYPVLVYRAPEPMPASLLPAAAAHAHNFFVQVALETGLVGLLTWLAALVWLASRLRSAWRFDPALGAIGLGLFSSFLINNTLEYTLVHSRGVLYAIGWGTVLGAVGAASRAATPKRGATSVRRLTVHQERTVTRTTTHLRGAIPSHGSMLTHGKLVAMPTLHALRRRFSHGTISRDLVLFGIFVAIVAWSLFFSIPRPGASTTAVAAAHYQGDVVVRVRDLSAAAWPEVHVGDVMPGIAKVTNTESAANSGRDLLVTLRVSGPIEYLNLRWPFPPKEGPIKIGSVVAFETSRYRFMGEVIRKSP